MHDVPDPLKPETERERECVRACMYVCVCVYDEVCYFLFMYSVHYTTFCLPANLETPPSPQALLGLFEGEGKDDIDEVKSSPLTLPFLFHAI